MKLFGFNITRSTDADKIESIGSFLKESERTIIPQSIVDRRLSKISGAPEKRKVSMTVDEAMPDNAGGRVTRETQDSISAYATFNSLSRSKKRTDYFALGQTFDIETVKHLSYDDLVELLADLSPEISKALWDFVLLCNAGYKCKALIPNTENPHEQAQTYIDDVILKTIGRYNGTAGTFFDRIFKMMFFRGSFLMELVLDEAGREFVDMASPDTRTLEYRRIYDEARGQAWTYGQRQDGQFVDFGSIETIRYIPIQPNPDSIEGTPLCTSAVFLAIFLMAVLRDVKRVIQNQGYPRLDVEIDFEAMKATMPDEIAGDSTKMKIWAQDLLNQVTEAYNRLRPESTYIHASTVKVNRPVGATTGDSIRSIDAIFMALERMIVRALKTMPILMGTNQSRSETQANREWEIYAKGIESMQHPVESAFEELVMDALIANGMLADVEMRFEQFRGAEAARDEEVKLLKLKVARTAYDNGYINQDEAAQYGFDKEVADEQEPRNAFDPNSFNAFGGGGSNLNDQSNGRSQLLERVRRIFPEWFDANRQPTPNDAENADNFWKSYAPENAKELIDAGIQEEETEQ